MADNYQFIWVTNSQNDGAAVDLTTITPEWSAYTVSADSSVTDSVFVDILNPGAGLVRVKYNPSIAGKITVQVHFPGNDPATGSPLVAADADRVVDFDVPPLLDSEGRVVALAKVDWSTLIKSFTLAGDGVTPVEALGTYSPTVVSPQGTQKFYNGNLYAWATGQRMYIYSGDGSTALFMAHGDGPDINPFDPTGEGGSAGNPTVTWNLGGVPATDVDAARLANTAQAVGIGNSINVMAGTVDTIANGQVTLINGQVSQGTDPLATTAQLNSAVWAQTRLRPSVPEQIEKPEAGDLVYNFGVNTYDRTGALADLDMGALPSVIGYDATGTPLGMGRIGAITRQDTGLYMVPFTVRDTDAAPQYFRFVFTGTQSGDSIGLTDYTWLVDEIGPSFTDADRLVLESIPTTLGTPAGGSLSADIAAIPAAPNASKIAAAVWEYLTSACVAAGSVGKRIVDFVTTLVYGDASSFTGAFPGSVLINTPAGPVGAGGIAFTVTVEDTLNNPLAGVSVWVTSDVNGATTIAGTLKTNVLGKATLMLPAGTCYVWRQSPTYNFPNPQAIVVS